MCPVVCDEFLKLIAEPGEEELLRARAQLKASLMMALESCFAQSEELARQLLVFGRRIPPDEIIAKVDAVDQEAIRRTGARLLAERRPDAGRDRAARPPSGLRHRSAAGCSSGVVAARDSRDFAPRSRPDLRVIRFAAAYRGALKCNHKPLIDEPNW